MKNYLMIMALLLLLTGCNESPPQVQDEFVRCRSLDGERAALKLLTWKFEAISAELTVACEIGKAMPAREIRTRMLAGLSTELRESLGEAEECIDLALKELEVRGKFVRIEDAGELKLARVI